MKKYFYFIVFITCACISTSFAQTAQTHVITLHVETQQIVKPNSSSFCNFGQDQSISNEDFTIEVNVGDVIRWEGVSSDAPATDSVVITSIDHFSGNNFFGAPSVGNNGQGKFVMGFICTGNPGDVQKYNLRFKVFNNGTQRNGTFIIDPKIKIIN